VEIMVPFEDQIDIETPEQIALEFPLAGIGSRFLAFAIDTVLQFVLYLAGTFALAATAKYAAGAFRWLNWIPVSWLPALSILFVFCIYWGYFAAFEILWRGQTPGKRLTGIRVIKDTGRPINVFEGIGRNLLRAVDGLPGLYFVGLVSMMISKRNQRLGDYLAGSIVVHEKRADEARPEWAGSGAGSDTGARLQAITPEELVLIETYLQRRDSFYLGIREQTARQIAERVTAKTGIERAPDQSLDSFLESIARQVRDQARFR
jgi:uncharacterized RDD family membrane protein YckC